MDEISDEEWNELWEPTDEVYPLQEKHKVPKHNLYDFKSVIGFARSKIENGELVIRVTPDLVERIDNYVLFCLLSAAAQEEDPRTIKHVYKVVNTDTVRRWFDNPRFQSTYFSQTMYVIKKFLEIK